MSILKETYTLSNDITIPKLGLGTWFIDDDQAGDAVKTAIGIGYRNIDTAQAYGNERGVGAGIRDSGVPREELFVSTKLAAEIKDYDQAAAAIVGRRPSSMKAPPAAASALPARRRQRPSTMRSACS